jgi:hypothetical protein
MKFLIAVTFLAGVALFGAACIGFLILLQGGSL